MKAWPGLVAPSLLALSAASLHFASTTDGADPPAKAAPKPNPNDFYTLGGFGGKVTKVGKDWFEIAPGWEGHLGGRKKQNEGNDQPIVVFTVGTRVGGAPLQAGVPNVDTYLLTDLKVGDIVSVDTSVTRAGQQFAVALIIRRRPGGKIPMLPPNQFGEPSFISGRNQAEQDWEEKGVPIPKKYLDHGRYPWTNPPYPPVAPMPREAKPAAPGKP